MGFNRHTRRLPGRILAIGALTMLLAACTGRTVTNVTSDMAPKSQQVFNYQLVTGAHDIAGLDPDVSFRDQHEIAQSPHAASLLPISLVFSGLVALDASLVPVNWDAQHIAVSPDGLKYTFTLRDGLKFSDGTPVTAADYAFSINRALDPCLASPVAYYLYEIKDAMTFNFEQCTPGKNGQPNTYQAGYGQTTPVLTSLLHDSVVAQDAKTLVITLGAPAAYFLAAMAYPTASAIEPTTVGANALSSAWTDNLAKGKTGQGGSGPYYVSSWDHQGTLVLKANPYFRQKPNIQTIHISIYSDPTAAYQAYTSGKDDIGYPPVSALPQAHKQKDYHQQGVLWTNYLGLNWKAAPFDNATARQAFALALNKDTLNATILGGADLPTNHIVPQGMPGYFPQLKGPDDVTGTQGNPAKAQALWQQYVTARCNGQASQCAPVTLTYSSNSPVADKLAPAMAQMWKSALGVSVTLQPEDYQTMLGQLLAGTVQFWMTGWQADYPDPQNWLSLPFWCCPEGEYNFGHVNNADANTLMTRADVNPDQAQRLQQYQQAEQLLVDQVAWIPYDQVVDHWQSRTWLHGYQETALGEPSLDQWLSMYVTKH